MKAVFILFLVIASTFSIYSQSMENLEKLVETEKAFAEYARDKSVRQAFIKFLTEDGLIFQPTAVNAREFWQNRAETPALLAWNPVWADISANGKLGYTTGDWTIHPTGKDSNAVAFGQYITIWKIQPDGNFGAILDIGISHEKPASVEKDWKSPENIGKSKARKEPKKSPNLQAENYEKFFAEDVRVYRNGKFPFIGKEDALAEIKIEKSSINSGKVLTDKCESSDDFRYCYGEIGRTLKDNSTEKANSLQIWKFRNGKWQIVLDLYSPLPVKKD